MIRERWQQVSQIFEAAMALEPEARASYVKAHCGADESLRREVESLIQSHQKAEDESFIEEHAVERAAPFLASDEGVVEGFRLEEGQEVGRYRVIKKIGAGGMGEIYMAKDMQLDRIVALKILPADVASDQRRMLRLMREAKIVSTLNQPNILTIFEFGASDTLHFIATEYVDGETLRRTLQGRKLKLLEIIDIAIQITAALDAAHEAKIVHRDIKPENIMIRRRDAVVKVLDFGLAKLTEKGMAPGQTTDTEADTEMLFETKPGSVMGTVNYMSPEQAQGFQVDERTDIWSTGVVLYEMVTGHIPFSGRTPSHIVVEILERDLPILTEVPAELERIASKALAKKPDERYQTAKDLLIDLKNLRKRLDVTAELERSIPPSAAGRATAPEPSVQMTETARATSGNAVATTSGSNMRTHWSSWKTVLPASVVVALLAGLLIIGFRAWSSSRSNVLPAAPATAPASERELSYWMMVQKYRDETAYDKPFRLAGEINFEKDYRVQLNVRSPQPGYLYILNEGPSRDDSLSILFPSPTANSGTALLANDQQIQIPEKSWFQFDAQQGTEKLWLIFSPHAVPELEAVKSFVNLQQKGVITSANLSRAAKVFIETNSISKPSVEKNDDLKETTVRTSGKVLVHLIKLEHH